MKNVLVIAPHPDDEIIGCGGTMSKHVYEGDNVYVCIVTVGNKMLYANDVIENGRKEAQEAAELLGVKSVFFLNYESNTLNLIEQYELNRSIEEILLCVNPDVVYIPFYGDIHYDHKAVADSCMVALRPKEGVMKRKIFAYEVPSETGWDAPFVQNAFIPNVFSDITDYLDIKVNAMDIYASQIKRFPNARSSESLVALAKYRGSMIGKKAAEAFVLIREVL